MVDAHANGRSIDVETSRVLPASAEHFRRSSEVIPGGASRARFWWPSPIYVERARGVNLHDIDGRTYIDCLVGFGSMILGHAHPAVMKAVAAQVARGTVFGAPCVQEEQLARLVVSNVPGAERAVFVGSGTEATMTALRIARAATGRDGVAKFEGGWHGAQDFLLHSFTEIDGELEAPRAVPQSAGVPRSSSRDVVVLPYNHDAALVRIRREAHRLACVIVEPVQGAAGGLPTEREFLERLRAVCDETGVLLVFDEVISGFRLGPAGAGGLYGVAADLVTLGKIIGGGLSIGAVVGRADLVGRVASGEGRPVAASGTFAANPLSMAAGVAQLSVLLDDPDTYPRLAVLGERMRDGLRQVLAAHGIRGWVTGVGSLWGLHFSAESPRTIRDLATASPSVARVLAAYLLLEGVVMSAPVHLGFLSTAHTEKDVDLVISAHSGALKRMKEEGHV